MYEPGTQTNKQNQLQPQKYQPIKSIFDMELIAQYMRFDNWKLANWNTFSKKNLISLKRFFALMRWFFKTRNINKKSWQLTDVSKEKETEFS